MSEPSVAATGFLLQLVTSRSKVAFPIILAFINEVLSSPCVTHFHPFSYQVC